MEKPNYTKNSIYSQHKITVREKISLKTWIIHWEINNNLKKTPLIHNINISDSGSASKYNG